MQLPGTLYHDTTWPVVKRLLLESIQRIGSNLNPQLLKHPESQDEARKHFCDSILHDMMQHRVECSRKGGTNLMGVPAFDLATMLVAELRARPNRYRVSLFNPLVRCHDSPNWPRLADHLFSDLRGEVDADNYQQSTGFRTSSNKLYQLRRVEAAAKRIQHLFLQWEANIEQVSAVLGRPIDKNVQPIETKQARTMEEVRPAWVLNWSATLAQFSPDRQPGPFHTKSKKMALPKTIAPEVFVGKLLKELATTEEPEVHVSTEEFLAKLAQMGLSVTEYGEDHINEPDEQEETSSEETEDERETLVDPSTEGKLDAPYAPYEGTTRSVEDDGEDDVNEDRQVWISNFLSDCDPPMKLAIYREMLGPENECYPEEWLDEDTGQIPGTKKLAEMSGLTAYHFTKQVNAKLVQLRMEIAANFSMEGILK